MDLTPLLQVQLALQAVMRTATPCWCENTLAQSLELWYIELPAHNSCYAA
jgi:hypothetical protein